ncbi:MAG: M20/M25/M40 family metallo-hydrolase [Phycisphaeraceae bacterium]|nr:M20/M25/M40 family metallo-hydrolase [Phycisphaeraceae bacterium]
MPSNAQLDFLAADAPNALERLKALVSIPSVSADPAYTPHVHEAAQWLRQTLSDLGLDAHVMPTDGHPAVVATTPASLCCAPADTPGFLFYGHYDVQPPDPVDLWTTPPFTPTIRDGCLFARGASDDKGQVSCFLQALRAWIKTTGKLPVPVTVLIEGEEECGSVGLGPFLKRQRELLTRGNTFVLVCDTRSWDIDGVCTPAVTYALRGLVYFDIQLHGPTRDLHSGVFGGTLANPATLLARVLGRLFDDQNRVTIPGFYDGVAPVTDEERARWAKLGFSEKEFLAEAGVTVPFGEAGFTTLERNWVRPACDVNGLYGGYQKAGAKTVIPTFAGAKVSFRLAPGQDPTRIARSFEQWLGAQDVGGCQWKFQQFGEACPVQTPTDLPAMAAVRRATKAVTGHEPAMIREGATIPVVAEFRQILGLDTILLGFGREEDCAHSPNERFRLANFELGYKTLTLLLGELAKA